MKRMMSRSMTALLVFLLVVLTLSVPGGRTLAEEEINLFRLPGVTFGPGYGILGGTKRIFDGDRTTHSDLLNHGCYVDVDLGRERAFSRSVIVLWDELGQDYVAAKFSLLISQDGEAYTPIAIRSNEVDRLSVFEIRFDKPVNARFVRLQFFAGSKNLLTVGADDQVRLREWELYGEAEGESIPEATPQEPVEIPEPDPELPPETRPNVATGLSPAAYSCNSGNACRLAFDGRYTTHCDLYGETGGEFYGTSWIQVDLEQVRNIDRWTVHNFVYGGNNYSFVNAAYTLYTADSPNGPWTAQDSVNNDYYQSYITDRMLPQPVNARYVRIWFYPSPQSGVLTVNADNKVRIDEIELFGNNELSEISEEDSKEATIIPGSEKPEEYPSYDLPEDLPEAVASGEDIIQTRPNSAFDASSTNANSSVAYIGDADDTTCWSSLAQNGDHWISVDLGRVYSIDRWTVISFPEDIALSVTGFELQVSLDNDRFIKVDSAYDTGEAGKTDRKLDKAVEARYVKLYIPVEMIGQDYVSRISSFCVYGNGVSENEQSYDLNRLNDAQDS